MEPIQYSSNSAGLPTRSGPPPTVDYILLDVHIVYTYNIVYGCLMQAGLQSTNHATACIHCSIWVKLTSKKILNFYFRILN